ncbi:MAG: hypothetical protein ACLFUU_12295 [Desulfobacteraceae bacterium]
MHHKGRYLMVILLAVGLVGLGLLGPAGAGDAGPLAALPSGPGIGATPTLTLNSSHLSDSQFGTNTVTTFRPGDTVYGVYDVTLSGANSNALMRTYKMGKFKLEHMFISPWSTGTSTWSWGHQIPENRAKPATNVAFYFNINAMEGNHVGKYLHFNIARYGIANSNRAYMDPMNPTLKEKIINKCKAVRGLLQNCALAYTGMYTAYSSNATIFLNQMKLKRQNAYLIHSHGSDTDGGRIYLKDESYVNATNLASSGFKAPGGLFYAAICMGATSSTLGNAFINQGCKAYIGYTVSVYTTRNADFYHEFFRRATQENKSVISALADTQVWAYAKGWTDVCTAKIIGEGNNLYLGGLGPVRVCATGADVNQAAQISIPKIVWRDVTTYLPSHAELQAVNLAEAVPAVQSLKAQYGADLVTGMEVFPEVYRVSYKAGDIFLYGVDVDKETGAIVEEGTLD